MYYIIKSFTDLRTKPILRTIFFAHYDEYQETQLLYGEKVNILSENSDWLYVQALDQIVIDPLTGEAKPYEGWIEKAAIGEKCEDAPCYQKQMGAELREHLLQLGLKFLNVPYVWGGMTHKGIDCSGLTHYLYRLCGYKIPRNAIDQYRMATKIELHDVQKGDLAFLAKQTTPHKIYHVMLYTGQNQWLEATSDSGYVRLISLEEKLAKNPESIVFTGSLISSPVNAMLSFNLS